MPRTTHRVGALLLPAVLLLIAACSAGPSDRPAVAHRDPAAQPTPQPPEPTPLPPLGKAAESRLNWQDCTDQTLADLGTPAPQAEMTFSCARLLTTLDSPETPARGTSRVALLSVGSGSIPLVVVNDVGGEPGTAFAARLAQQLPPEALSTFKIIGMDRRGTGRSDPPNCVPPAERNAITEFDARATDRAELDGLLDSVRQSSQECLLNLDHRLPAYDTRRAASDLEELRLELRVPKLHAIGRGEAARLLTTYSERFPNSVGRMVLDGAPDPLLDARGQGETAAQGSERTFDAFAADCTGGSSCPLGPDPRKTVGELVERTRSAPIPAPSGSVTSGEIVQAMLIGLADQTRWPELAAALEAANRGSGAPLAALVAPLTTGNSIYGARLDGKMITSCNDTTLRVPPEQSARIATDWVERFPLFGGVFAQRLVWCGLWPVPQQALPQPKNPALPPIPVISTATDPLTPARGTDHMAEQLPSAVLLNWQGTGHGALGRSECVTAIVSRFLVGGTVPTPGTACPA